jgi:two-component system chemotaxis response regulator CheB
MNSSQSAREYKPFSVLLIATEGLIDQRILMALEKTDDVIIDARHTSSINAVSDFRHHHFDVVILDIGMPDEDGIVTIRRLIRIDRHVKIIMASTLSFANVRKSMAGFENGAAEFIQPPSDFTSNKSDVVFANSLSRMIRGLGQARRTEPLRQKPAALTPPAPPDNNFTLRPFSDARPQVLAIGSSTGGPAALTTLLSALPADFPLPIVITQHMPATFTAVLATTLEKRTGKLAGEGQDDMLLQANRIYIAPGDFHMTFKGRSGDTRICINQDPPVNYCRPSVNPMVTSLASIYSASTLLVILNGMGADGLSGAEKVIEHKGTVIAQDFETSVVWGMPRAVAEAGLCSEVLPLSRIASAINRLLE